LIIPIKKEYKLPEVQSDLTHDGIVLMTKNISANFFCYNKRKMNNDEVNECVKWFIDYMNIENDLDVEWNQTS